MAVASASKEKTETSEDSFPSSPLASKPDSDVGSETSSVGISGVVDAFDPNDQSDFSAQQRKDVEIQDPALFKSEEYRLLFRLPPDDVLVRDFNCAFQESILLQGHMYLFGHHICFYSNIFGFETKKTIPFDEVTCVRKAKTAAIFPNAIEIVAGTKKYFFASFLSRDEAYRLIVDGWSQHSNVTGALIDNQDSKSELRSQGNRDVANENLKNCEEASYNLNIVNRDAHVSGESKRLSNVEDNISASTILFESLENGEDNAVPVVGAQCSSSGTCLKWKLEDVDAPAVPEYYKKVAESRFPIEVEEFFNLFFSDDAVGFVETFHTKCGDKDFTCTSWYEHEHFGHVREVSFQHPIKIYFGAKFGRCQEVQKFRVYRNSHLAIETSQEVSDVPYADYFCVQGLWVVEKDGNEKSGCILRVYVNVAFSKKTMWKGKIEQSTIEECQEAYSTWLNMAHELLKQENLTKPEETGYPINMIQSGKAPSEGNEKKEGASKRVHHSRQVPRIPQVASASDDNMLEGNPVQGDMDKVFNTHSLSELLRKFWSHLKSRNHLSLLLVIASLFMILLMQLSIIVLLSRAPQVHIISQRDYARHTESKVEGQTETLAWFEMRIRHLKDEMLLVEGRLERMLHEQAMLKAQLKSLEELKEAT